MLERESMMRSISPAVWSLGWRFDPALHAPMSRFGSAKLLPLPEVWYGDGSLVNQTGTWSTLRHVEIWKIAGGYRGCEILRKCPFVPPGVQPRAR